MVLQDQETSTKPDQSKSDQEEEALLARAILGEDEPNQTIPQEISTTYEVLRHELPLDDPDALAAFKAAGYTLVVTRGHYNEELSHHLYRDEGTKKITASLNPNLIEYLQKKEWRIGSSTTLDRTLFQSSSQGGNLKLKIILFSDCTLCCIPASGQEAEGPQVLAQIMDQGGSPVNLDQLKQAIVAVTHLQEKTNTKVPVAKVIGADGQLQGQVLPIFGEINLFAGQRPYCSDRRVAVKTVPIMGR